MPESRWPSPQATVFCAPMSLSSAPHPTPGTPALRLETGCAGATIFTLASSSWKWHGVLWETLALRISELDGQEDFLCQPGEHRLRSPDTRASVSQPRRPAPPRLFPGAHAPRWPTGAFITLLVGALAPAAQRPSRVLKAPREAGVESECGKMMGRGETEAEQDLGPPLMSGRHPNTHFLGW